MDLWHSYKEQEFDEPVPDPVNHPEHYKSHPSGVNQSKLQSTKVSTLEMIKYCMRRNFKGGFAGFEEGKVLSRHGN